MRKIFLLTLCLSPFLLLAQETFSGMWQKVDTLISIKNYNETVPQLEAIKRKAKAEKNSPQWIRAVLATHFSLTTNQDDEQSFQTINAHFKRATTSANPTEKALLQNFYAQYLNSQIYRYTSEKTDGFSAASQEEKIAQIDALFQQALTPKALLVQSKTADWKDLFQQASSTALVPTLYHFLAHSYLEFLTNNEPHTTKKRELLEKELQQVNLANKHVEAAAYLALRTPLQNLYLPENRDQLEQFLLKNKAEYNVYAYSQLAQQYANMNQKNIAVEKLNYALANYPNSPWIAYAQQQYNELSKARIYVQHNHTHVDNAYLPIKLTTQNLNKLYIKVFNTTRNPNQSKEIPLNFDSLSKKAILPPALQYEETLSLPDFTDYNQHSTNYKINPLPAGNYKIVYSNHPDFIDDNLKNDVSSSDLIVSNLFITATQQRDKGLTEQYKLLLIDRQSGTPYAHKNVKIYRLDKGKSTFIKNYKTDALGEFIYETKDAQDRDNLRYLSLYIAEENQFITLNTLLRIPQLNQVKIQNQESNKQAMVLLDRGIYRPGQPLYFKAILYDNHNQTGKVIGSEPLKIYLKDANYQTVDSLTLNTNMFGSVNGQFTLPKATLNGSFQLEVQFQDQQIAQSFFQVEEYKRPTFKVSFDINKETYTKKDTAQFTGRVESLTGVPLPNAEVKINVDYYNTKLRKVVSLQDSSIYSDQKGKFSISVPLQDSSFAKLTQINLNYRATVINQNGEIQMANANYTYQDKPWNLALKCPRTVYAKQWSSLSVLTTNPNGQALPFAGTVSIYKLESPKVVVAKAYAFSFAEEYHLLDKAAYETYFPTIFDPLSLADEVPKKRVATYTFDTRDTSLVKLDSTLFSNGEYLIEAKSVFQQDTILATQNIVILNPATNKMLENEMLSTKLAKKTHQIGDKATVTFQTDLQETKGFYLWEIQGNQKGKTQYLPFKNGLATYEITLQKDQISQPTHLEAFILKDNKIDYAEVTIPIQRTDKALQLLTKTFRDKITPGKSESWSFTVKKEQSLVEAEVLATLYDAALDNFRSNEFSGAFPLYSNYYASNMMQFLTREFQNIARSNTLNNAFVQLDLQPLFPMVNTYGLWNDSRSGYFSNGAVPRLIRSKAFAADAVMEGSLVAVPNGITIRGNASLDQANSKPLYVVDGEIVENYTDLDPATIDKINILKAEEATALYGSRAANGVVVITTKEGAKKEALLAQAETRTNLQETAFFFPTLYTDKAGDVTFTFDSPEALSKWKLLLFAHTKNLDAGSQVLYTHTQKQLMVRPNLPRFLREGDELQLKAQIQNLTDQAQKGFAKLEITDAQSNAPLNALFLSDAATKDFEAQAANTTTVAWSLKIPKGHPAVHVRIVAANDAHSDGELQDLYILPNEVLISESQKIVLDPKAQQQYPIRGAGKTNLQAKVTVQSNPILEIIAALDYLKTYPYDCAEQTASKWFALKTVDYIAKQYPALADYFEKLDSATVNSRLAENSALSELAIQEMPWMRSIANDKERLKTLAQLFNKQQLVQGVQDTEAKLARLQKQDGSYPWFDGGLPSRDISIRILEVMGKVKALDPTSISPQLENVAQGIILYLDADSTILRSSTMESLINYGYARQFWSQISLPKATQLNLVDMLKETPQKTAKLSAGMAAKAYLVSRYLGQDQVQKALSNRIDQEYVNDPIQGRYWKSNANQYNAISLQTYLIEAYKQLDSTKLQSMTDWIYYSKQANNWYTTWMSVDAIYALLISGNPTDFKIDNQVTIQVADTTVATKPNGIGQISLTYTAADLNRDKDLVVKNNNDRRVYGSINHQYFMPLEKVEAQANELRIEKKILVYRQDKWIESLQVKTGERVKVQLTLIADKNYSYLHLKDSRAAGVEPLYQPSGYQAWRRYYFTLNDASTNYFFDQLGRGKHVYEYEVKTNMTGTFNCGFAEVLNMYDPSVNARSTNLRLEIK